MLARIVIIGAVAAALGMGWWLQSGQLPESLSQPIVPSAEFRDRHGMSLRTLLVDDRAQVLTVQVSGLPKHLIQAVLAAEDKRFYEHPGVDLMAMVRALTDRCFHGRRLSGASTISQQLVKMASPGERTLGRKLAEIRGALAVERAWSKDEILQQYLSRLEYGDLQQGIESAAEYYFGKPASALSLAESAFLAAIPNAPARLNPHRNREATVARQHYVLARMLANGWISNSAYARALEESLVLQSRGIGFRAPHFVHFLLTRQGAIPESGGGIGTTLDLALNDYAESLIRSQLLGLREKNAGSGAVVVIHNPTGELLVMACAGGASTSDSAEVNSAWTPRSPGSAIKPFTYLLAMEAGYYPGTIVPDIPSTFQTPTGAYRPNNYNHRFYGPVSLRFALGNSLNVAAIRTLQLAGGPSELLRLLRQLGMTTLGYPAEHYGLGLTLGNGEARLAELANAYATLARMGVYRPLQFFEDGVAARDPGSTIFSRESAWLVTNMLSDPSARAASFGLDSYLALPFPAACKTGTSSNYRDNIAVGYTPEFTVAVWVGNADGSPMREVTGVTGAAPIMHEMLCHLHATTRTTAFVRPNGIRNVTVHPLTGKVLPDGSDGARVEPCVIEPPRMEPTDFDALGRVKLSAEYAEWLSSSQNPLGNLVVGESRAGPLVIASPDPGTVFVLDPNLPAEHQRVVFRVKGNRPVRWSCKTLIQAGESGRFFLREGIHQVLAEDPEASQSASTWIEVRAL